MRTNFFGVDRSHLQSYECPKIGTFLTNFTLLHPPQTSLSSENLLKICLRFISMYPYKNFSKLLSFLLLNRQNTNSVNLKVRFCTKIARALIAYPLDLCKNYFSGISCLDLLIRFRTLSLVNSISWSHIWSWLSCKDC